MSEKAKELQKKLFNKKENGVDFMSDEELKACDDFCEGYKKFLFENKTEREFAASALKLAQEHGFLEFDKFGKALEPGDKVYYFNREKAIILAVKGKRPICDGVRISAAHIDSPRLDLKQCPVYEDGNLGFFKTHYYGGIKKYQWTAIPLSLHGRICKNDGTYVDVKVGEDPADPKFCITDILPHLGAEQMSRKANEIVKGEELNVVIGSRPFKDDEVSEKIKLNLLNILFEKYGIVERDFLSAELELVPAFSVDDIGFDRSLIGGYGLDDPCGRVLETVERPNGLVIKKVSCPMGVIGIIYEARPNVTADAAALCLKSGNAVILRGGKEAIHSNIAISDIMREAVKSVGLDENVIQLVHDTSRESSTELMKMKGTLDCLIPRGSKRLIQAVVENASVPVIETGSGNCHIYVDESADINMAANIIFNAKTQRIGVCNACESLVIHENIIKKALPAIKARLDEKNVTIRGDEKAREACPGIEAASEEDFGTEYLDYIISVKTVSSLDEAIAHINKYSTGHSEAIITENKENADKFMMLIDSSSVYHNASTRFTDGGEFGLGAEIGISTQKLHARGPMGLRELTTTKYLVYGDGQIR